jgi:addiction module HigA family antidote
MKAPAPTIAPSRRRPAPHPGPALVRDFLEPLHLDADSLAAAIGMDAAVLAEMLAGKTSIDVETAVRLSRSLQLNPQKLMERQLLHDFAAARDNVRVRSIPVLTPRERVDFPEGGFLRGRLAGLQDTAGFGDVRFETLGFFADPLPGHDMIASMHTIRRGVRLRIYGPDGLPIWVGTVLETLEGNPLLPYARPSTWIEWFVRRFRADFIAAPDLRGQAALA